MVDTLMVNRGLIDVTGLPEQPLDAAAHFHAVFVPQVRCLAASGDVVLILPHADHTHDAWRQAAIAELAREAVPYRVNAVEGKAAQGVAETLHYLHFAAGVTGQVLRLPR